MEGVPCISFLEWSNARSYTPSGRPPCILESFTGPGTTLRVPPPLKDKLSKLPPMTFRCVACWGGGVSG